MFTSAKGIIYKVLFVVDVYIHTQQKWNETNEACYGVLYIDYYYITFSKLTS